MTQYNNNSMTRSPRRRKQNLDTTAKILIVAFAVVGIILAIIGGKFVFNLVKGWSLTSLPGAPVGSSDTGVNPGTGGDAAAGIPLQSNNAPAAATWDGKSRINILLLGLDYSTKRQAQDQGSPLSDTMILVTVDPLTQTIGAMSIRRDLWVNIPGFEYNKINAAYKLGEDYQLPEGGAGLAMDTVESLLGVPIDFYARVDFNAFKRIIDEIGGVPITLQQPMLLDWMGNGNKFWIEPGTYVMPGNYVLAYARTRDAEYGDGDYARGNRQMEVISAIRDRVLNLNNLATLVARAPAIYNEISAGVQTNMTLDQAVQLAYLMAQIPRENMSTYNISQNEAPGEITPDGIYILRVIPDQLRLLRDQMFTASGVAAAPIVLATEGVISTTSDPLPLAITENARIQILNGTNVGGLAEETMAFLNTKGLTNITTGNTDLTESTRIILHNPVQNTLSYLAATMGVPNSRINMQASDAFDITVIIGNDWATTNPMP
jgi:LCP family protein required for cell wall assembly